MFHTDTASTEDRLARALRRAERERAARIEAEALLERKSIELFQSNEKLREQAGRLEQLVQERTAALQEALARAEAATVAKSDFLATMSHEIRTPLNGIIGLADVLALSPLDAEQAGHVELLIKSGQSLLALINDILDFSKIEAGHLLLEDREFDPKAELLHVAEMFRPLATDKGINLSVRIGDLPELVEGDSLRIRQVVSNLLSNAIKFTPSGEVVLEARSHPLEAEGAGWRLDVSVKDSGIGISANAIGHIFEPFSQADSSTTRRFGGTGLGLAICKKLVTAMGGGISVESGAGSTFRFHVHLKPLMRGGGSSPADGLSCASSAIPDLKILVVEDNPVNQTVTLALLKKLGQKAELVSSGAAAVERVRGGVFDLVFMDMQMPGMDGIEATEAIRALPLAHQPRIIALTANAFESDRARCLEAGMDGFLSKPFRLEDLRGILCSVCKGCAG